MVAVAVDDVVVDDVLEVVVEVVELVLVVELVVELVVLVVLDVLVLSVGVPSGSVASSTSRPMKSASSADRSASVTLWRLSTRSPLTPTTVNSSMEKSSPSRKRSSVAEAGTSESTKSDPSPVAPVEPTSEINVPSLAPNLVWC